MLIYSGRTMSSNGMIFGATYSHTDMLKMGCRLNNATADLSRLSSSSSLITAPPTAVNNLTIPTSYSDFIDQTEDGTILLCTRFTDKPRLGIECRWYRQHIHPTTISIKASFFNRTSCRTHTTHSYKHILPRHSPCPKSHRDKTTDR